MEHALIRQHRLVVLVSGGGTNLQAIIDAIDAGSLAASCVLVVANRPGVGGLERAERAGVDTAVVSVRDGEPRSRYDARLAEVVAAAAPDVVVLAGWMRILSSTFLDHFPNRVINLHPARPGELPGVHAIERAWREMLAGQRSSTGVMVHLVPDEGVDDGPLLATVDVPIEPDDTLDRLTTRVRAAEHALLVETLASFLTDHLTPTELP